jgi:hypothetical protein
MSIFRRQFYKKLLWIITTGNYTSWNTWPSLAAINNENSTLLRFLQHLLLSTGPAFPPASVHFGRNAHSHMTHYVSCHIHMNRPIVLRETAPAFLAASHWTETRLLSAFHGWTGDTKCRIHSRDARSSSRTTKTKDRELNKWTNLTCF